jgi:hypothetical protein
MRDKKREARPSAERNADGGLVTSRAGFGVRMEKRRKEDKRNVHRCFEADVQRKCYIERSWRGGQSDELIAMTGLSGNRTVKTDNDWEEPSPGLRLGFGNRPEVAMGRVG